MTHSRILLYVSCGATQAILRFAMDRGSGALHRLGETLLPDAPSPVIGGTKPARDLRSNGAPLAVSRDGKTIYAATRTEPCKALSWRVSPQDGALDLIGQAPIPHGTPYISTDRSGRLLFGAAYHANCVWVSRIAADGAVDAEPMQIVEQLGTTHCVLVHSSNDFVYVASTGRPGIQIFGVSDGAQPLVERREATASSADATPRHLAIRPDERFLYCMNETSSIVDVFAVSDGGGGLTLVQSVDLRPEDARDIHGLGADILVTADGRFLYCTERVRGTLAAFAIDEASGRLSPVQTISMGSIPRSVAVDPSGRFMANAVQGDGVVHIHAISPADGSLTLCGTYETGGNPIWVEFVSLP